MFLIQVLLPLADNNGVRFEQAMFDEVHHHLAMQFGASLPTPGHRCMARGRSRARSWCTTTW